MKRFWKEVAVDAVAHGHAIALDGRRVRTPARAELVVASPALAEAIAGEWRECGATVDPRAMPLTGLANAAIDRVGVDCGRFAAELARFGEGDLLCYRADHPARLVALQAATWDPLLDWARGRFECDFTVTDGIIHRAQPPATVERLAAATAAMGAFTLAGLAPLVTIGGSLVAALARVEQAIDLETLWRAVSLDERFQLDHWGRDAEAEAMLAARHRDIAIAARFLDLLGSA